eukprot:CAMPEP_0119038840 /NCGR_PEP_ID=MMETSP1177-20130426/8005_1 /TAXON_ID=2985 /ORGANISM="Ochromonas sp, Strain CCMP1899" /LENGTH=234 /DNA_ID=CAMNT_0007001941 /DNA_START=164 /DNA_END=868 /DNA_ORIENTATION=-
MKVSKYLGTSPVFVAGGTRGIGLEVMKKLSDLGTPVHILARNPETKDVLESFGGVTVTVGDALNTDDISKCMAGCVAAITTLGGRTGESPANNRIDYTGNFNVVEQAEKLGVERVILVTSIGCGATKQAVSPTAYSVLEKAITEKNKVEKTLQSKTKMDWTIIRPGGLKNDKGTGKGILTTDVMASGVINRMDVADLIIQVLASDKCSRMELTAVDPSQVFDAESEKKLNLHVI